MLVRLDKEGKVVKTAKPTGENRRAAVAGIAVTEKYVFTTCPGGWDVPARGAIVRFTRDLTEPKQIAKGLRGCCARMDLAAKDKVLYIAENARYRVVRLDFEGKQLSTWGKKSRDDLAGFGACCNPMNITVGPDGNIYTGESGLGRIKCHKPDGKLVALIGYVGTKRFSGRVPACSHIPVAVSKDCRTVYVQDFPGNKIRILTAEAPASQPAKE